MSWINKALAVVGIPEPGVGSEFDYPRRADAEYYGEDRLNFRKPTGFDEVEEIADLLKEEQPIVLNLEKTDADERRRIVDFLFGVIYAVDGDVCRVADGVFIFTPNRINIDAPDVEVARRAFAPTMQARPLRQTASM